MRVAIVCVGVAGWYPRGQERLGESIKKHAPQCTPLFFRDCYPETSPTHQGLPYAFKHHAMIAARKKDFDVAIWCDCAVWLIKDPATLIQTTVDRGVWISKAGWTVGHWSTDESLKLLKLDREDAFKIPMAMGTMYGVNLRDARATGLLDYLLENEKAMAGPWKNENGEASSDKRVLGHRHDQVLLSKYCYENGIPMDDHPSFLAYPSHGEPAEIVVALAQGM